MMVIPEGGRVDCYECGRRWRGLSKCQDHLPLCTTFLDFATSLVTIPQHIMTLFDFLNSFTLWKFLFSCFADVYT